MTIHVSATSYSSSSTVPGLDSDCCRNEGEYSGVRMCFSCWRHGVASKHDCWRRGVIVCSSLRYRVKLGAFRIMRSLFMCLSSERRRMELEVNEILSGLMLSIKLNVIFAWFGVANLSKRRIVLMRNLYFRHFRCLMNSWMVHSVDKAVVRNLRHLFSLKYHFKVFRSCISLRIQWRVKNDLLVVELQHMYSFRLWMLFVSVRHVYCRMRVEKLRLGAVFGHFFQIFRNFKAVASTTNKTKRNEFFHSWQILLSALSSYRRNLICKSFHQIQSETEKSRIGIFFSIWKKHSKNSHFFVKFKTIEKWREHVAMRRKETVIVERHRIRRMKKYLEYLREFFFKSQKCTKICLDGIRRKYLLNFARFAFFKKQVGRKFFICSSKWLRKQMLRVFVYWSKLLKAVSHSRSNLVCVLRQWRREKLERKKMRFSAAFWAQKVCSFVFEKWIGQTNIALQLCVQRALEIAEKNRGKDFWKRWQRTRPTLRIERARWRLASQFCTDKCLTKLWKVVIAHRNMKKAQTAFFLEKKFLLNQWRRRNSLNFFVNFLKQKIRNYRIADQSRLQRLSQWMEGWQQWLLRVKKMRLEIGMTRFLYFGHRAIGKNFFVKMKFLDLWVTHHCKTKVYQREQLQVHWEEWMKLMDKYSRAKSAFEMKKNGLKLVCLRAIRDIVNQHRRINTSAKSFEIVFFRTRFGEFMRQLNHGVKLKKAREIYVTMAVKRGITKMLAAYSRKQDELESEFVATVVNRRFLLGKRVARRWRRYLTICCMQKIQDKIHSIKHYLTMAHYYCCYLFYYCTIGVRYLETNGDT